MNLLKHRFTSPKPDGSDLTQIQPSSWNDGHAFTGGNAGDVLTRDPTDTSYGAKWAPPTSSGAGLPPGGNLGDLLARDATVPDYGALWTPPPTGTLVAITNADTGTINDWSPAGLGSKSTYIQWGGVTPLTVTGIRAGVEGQLLTVHALSPAGMQAVHFVHASPASAVGNRLSLLAGSAPTSILAGGVAQFVYSAGGWRLMAHEQGWWITPPYVASDYFGSGSMVWTVESADVWQRSYRLTGRTLQWAMYLSGTALTGTMGATLNTKIPGGFTASAAFASSGLAYGGSPITGVVCMYNGGNAQFLRDLASANWPSGPLNLIMAGTLEVA